MLNILTLILRESCAKPSKKKMESESTIFLKAVKKKKSRLFNKAEVILRSIKMLVI
nr:MAG TPA: hypothetical protein [Caudoviricetes sp.]